MEKWKNLTVPLMNSLPQIGNPLVSFAGIPSFVFYSTEFDNSTKADVFFVVIDQILLQALVG